MNTITLVPFEPKLIDFELMNREQIEWYNQYNEKIKEKVCKKETKHNTDSTLSTPKTDKNRVTRGI